MSHSSASILNHTLEELDGEQWGDPEWQSHLVLECHRLRKVPLKDFTAEDLRLVIGQNFSLEYLVPVALVHLAKDPWVSGDYFEGDLLQNVLAIGSEVWRSHPDLKAQMDAIVDCAIDAYLLADVDETELHPAWVIDRLQLWRGSGLS